MRVRGKMLAVVLGLCVLLASAWPMMAAETVLPSGVADEALAAEIETFVAEHEATTAGMAVSVFRQDAPVYTGYFGAANKERAVPVDEETVMEWGSATKLLVWVSVMQLWEQGMIDLDADVCSYLPEDFLTTLSYDTPVTMLDLMNHTAGFQEVYADLFVKDASAILPLGEMLQAHEPAQIYDPGTVTAYSNWGAALAAYIVECVSGESFVDYVHEHIFSPLGMMHSALAPDLSDNVWVQEQRQQLASYTAEGTLMSDSFYYITLYPAGMCTSTLSDFTAFAQALLNPASPLFEQASTWETLFTPTNTLDETNLPVNMHGLWVVPYGVLTVGHGGNTAGCSSYVLLAPEEGVGAVVMTNQSAETVYNTDMMTLIFGDFSADQVFTETRQTPEGLYRSARTMREGPFKPISLSFYGDDYWADNEYWAAGSANGVDIVCMPYGDYLRVSPGTIALEVALVAAWGVALVCAAVSVVAAVGRRCLRRPRKTLGGWRFAAALSQLAAAVAVAVIVQQAMSYAVASSYSWLCGVIGVLALVMLVLAGWGGVRLRRALLTKRQRLWNGVVVLLLLVTVVNIGYWNLFMWWKI